MQEGSRGTTSVGALLSGGSGPAQQHELVMSQSKWSIGVHYCRNIDGSRSGYVGVVPKNATAAVIVHVRHKPYPVTDAGSTFATLAEIPFTGWKAVSDDTAP